MSAATLAAPPVPPPGVPPTAPAPSSQPSPEWYRLTVAQYHQMIEARILGEEDPIELLDGYLVLKMPRGIAHDFAICALNKRLLRLVPDNYRVSNQCAATLADDSEPEPDFTVARGDEDVYRHRKPGAADTAFVIEVSASSLGRDRGVKARIYAAAGVPVYWVVNVDAKQVEVYTQPGGTGDAAAYARQDVFPVGTDVPVVLDGATVGTIAVADLMG